MSRVSDCICIRTGKCFMKKSVTFFNRSTLQSVQTRQERICLISGKNSYKSQRRRITCNSWQTTVPPCGTTETPGRHSDVLVVPLGGIFRGGDKDGNCNTSFSSRGVTFSSTRSNEVQQIND